MPIIYMKYWDKVKVTSWFYEWIEWTVIRQPETLSSLFCWEPIDKNKYYTIRLWNDDDIHDITLPESNLELIK